jgi:branched-chain amino acid transport system permease protein
LPRFPNPGLDPDDRLLDPDAGVDPLWAVAAAPVVTGVVAALIGVPRLRLRGHYLAFATLAFHLIMLSLLFAQDRFFGVSTVSRSRSRSMSAATPWTARGTQPSCGRSSRSLSCSLRTSCGHAPAGRSRRSPLASRPAAGTGIAVATFKLRLFVFAAALAGLAGGLFTFYAQFVGPEDFGIVLSLLFVLMVAVGGLGNVYGAVVGTVAILYLEHEVRELGTRESLLGWDRPAQAPSVLSLGVFGLILIVVKLFFPRGLLPALLDGARAARHAAMRSAPLRGARRDAG